MHCPLPPAPGVFVTDRGPQFKDLKDGDVVWLMVDKNGNGKRKLLGWW